MTGVRHQTSGIRLQTSGVSNAAIGLILYIAELQTSAFPFFSPIPLPSSEFRPPNSDL